MIGDAVGSARALDVEFLLRADRSLVILQARPYALRWTQDRHRQAP